MRHVALGLGFFTLLAIVASCGGGGPPACGGGGSDDPPPVPAALQILPADRQVSHNEETDALWPQVAAWDDNVYVVWLDGRTAERTSTSIGRRTAV